jgi:hypothetical protein
MRVLGSLLAAHTTTPDECVICFWAGWGGWGGQVGYTHGHTPEETAAAYRAAVERAERERQSLASVPLLWLPHREHYVFHGPLSRTGRAFMIDHVWEQSPSMWWPADRAWFVATEVDGYFSYVGGAAACVDAILAEPGLRARPAAADDPLFPDAGA